MEFLLVIYVACAALGSTFAIAALSSGSGRLPRLVMAWPFIVVLGSVAAVGPGGVAGILQSFYTVAALAFFVAAAVAAAHHHRVDSARPVGVTATVLMTMAMPLVASLALWGGTVYSVHFFVALGSWMPIFAVLTRLNYLRDDNVMAALLAVTFVFVMVECTSHMLILWVPPAVVAAAVVLGFVGVAISSTLGALAVRRVNDGLLSGWLKVLLLVFVSCTVLHGVANLIPSTVAIPAFVNEACLFLAAFSAIAALAGLILHDIRQAVNPPEELQTCSGVPAAE